MRISTTQIFQQGVSALQTKQSDLQQTQLQLSSGLRIMKPSDDPSGAVKVHNLANNIAVVDQYEHNVAVAESSLAFEESILVNVNNSLQRIRELAIQGNNSSYSDNDRASIAHEIYGRLDELLALANTRDSSGEYIFAGDKVESLPFINDGNSVQYAGNQGQRLIQVGQSSQVAIRDSGDAVFQSIPGGDGNIQIASNPSNSGNLRIGSFGASSASFKDNYTISFSQASASDPIVYTVTNESSMPPQVVGTGNYNEGSIIAFADAHVSLSGTPANGDQVHVSPSSRQSLFGIVKNIADALSTPTPDTTSNAAFHNDMAVGLAGLDQALDHINDVRAGIGARLNNVNTLDEINQDFKLQLETVLSDTQDLDYAEAISRFNLQLTALQAAQQAFVKTSGLSLFQYL